MDWQSINKFQDIHPVRVKKAGFPTKHNSIRKPEILYEFKKYSICKLFMRLNKNGRCYMLNIKPQFLIDNNFNFKYSFDKSLAHWSQISPEDFQ